MHPSSRSSVSEQEKRDAPSRSGEDSPGARRIVRLALLAGVLGAVHHTDHIVRANHVGWPITSGINPFTFSLFVYPLLFGGAWVASRRPVSAWYWLFVSLAIAMLVTWVHFTSDPRGEQVKDLYLPYAEPSAYCAHHSAADPVQGPSALCDPESPARPLIGGLAVVNMLILVATLWTLAAASGRELLRGRRRRMTGAPPSG